MDISRVATARLFSHALKESSFPVRLRELFVVSEYPWQVLANWLPVLREMILEAKQQHDTCGEISASATCIGEEIFVEAGAKIEDFAYIQSPAYISSGAVVRSGAYLRGGVYLGHQALVGHSCEVKASLLLAKAKVSHHSYVGDSLLGYGVNLGAGTKTANLRFDQRAMVFELESGGERKTLSTGLRKLGAIFGDHGQTGCNAVTNPGVILTARSVVLPLKNVSGIVDRPFAS